MGGKRADFRRLRELDKLTSAHSSKYRCVRYGCGHKTWIIHNVIWMQLNLTWWTAFRKKSLYFLSFLDATMTDDVAMEDKDPVLLYRFKTMAADVMATQGAMASTAMVLTLLFREYHCLGTKRVNSLTKWHSNTRINNVTCISYYWGYVCHLLRRNVRKCQRMYFTWLPRGNTYLNEIIRRIFWCIKTTLITLWCHPVTVSWTSKKHI